MTTRQPSPRGFRALAMVPATALLACLAAATAAQAAVAAWTGGAGPALSTPANWSGSAAPVPGDSIALGASPNRTLASDLAPSFPLAGVAVTAGAAGNYTISGNGFALSGDISTANSCGVTFDNPVVVSGRCRINLAKAIGSFVTFAGNVSGAGSLVQSCRGIPAVSVGFGGDNSGFTGSFTQDNNPGNRTAFNSPASGSASAAWTFNRGVNGGVALNNIAGRAISFGSLSGGGWMRANSPGVTTISVGALGADTTWSGRLNDNNLNGGKVGVIALVKTGAGTFTMGGAGNYTGGTTIGAGTLLAANPLALGAGDIVINGGVLASSAGLSGIGNLTLSSGGLDLDLSADDGMIATLAPGKGFAMTGGAWTIALGAGGVRDPVVSAGAGVFAITGGTLVLTGPVDYRAAYAILRNFRSGSVANLSITGYDRANYAAVLGADGVLTFAPAGIPAPSAYR